MTSSYDPRIYPDHLYDSTRIEVATQLLEKEMKKQFGPMDVRTWVKTTDAPSLWNAVEGIMGGLVLKPIVQYLTAQNYSWTKRELMVGDIQFSSKLAQLDRISSLKTDALYASRVTELLGQDPTERRYQLETVRRFSADKGQDDFPILVAEKEGRPMVLDGNRRVLRALLEGEQTIDAWYCKTNNELPKNFWYPIDDLMRLVKIYNGSKETSESIQEDTRGVLRELFLQSEVARIAFMERVVGSGTKGASDLIPE